MNTNRDAIENFFFKSKAHFFNIMKDTILKNLHYFDTYLLQTLTILFPFGLRDPHVFKFFKQAKITPSDQQCGIGAFGRVLVLVLTQMLSINSNTITSILGPNLVCKLLIVLS